MNGEMSREQELEDELRTVRHDLEHVTAERDRAAAERDMLGRQHEALIDLTADAESANRSIEPSEIWRLITTDPGDNP